MKTLLFIYNENYLVVDSFYKSLNKEDLNIENNSLLDMALLNETKEDYLTIFKRFSVNELMQHRLMCAWEFKKSFPQHEIYFYNENNYYDLETNEEGFSLIPNDFDISQHILVKGDRVLRVMFDWAATGVWNNDACIPLEWVPVSEKTKKLIDEFQSGLNKQRIVMDEDDVLTDEEEKEAEYYLQLALDAAIAIKKELPHWKIEIYNDGQYDLPFNEWGNSEIT